MKRVTVNIAKCHEKLNQIKGELDKPDASRSVTELRSNVDELSEILESMSPEGLYEKFEPAAYNVKVAGQMLVGAVVVCLVAQTTIMNIVHHLQFVQVEDTLTTVSGGLAVAATLELAYAFFTNGPDEAIEPLILGLSAAILLAITSLKTPTWAAAGLIAALVVALALLFIVRDLFIVEVDERRIPHGFRHFRPTEKSRRRVLESDVDQDSGEIPMPR